MAGTNKRQGHWGARRAGGRHKAHDGHSQGQTQTQGKTLNACTPWVLSAVRFAGPGATHLLVPPLLNSVHCKSKLTVCMQYSQCSQACSLAQAFHPLVSSPAPAAPPPALQLPPPSTLKIASSFQGKWPAPEPFFWQDPRFTGRGCVQGQVAAGGGVPGLVASWALSLPGADGALPARILSRAAFRSSWLLRLFSGWC